MRSGSRLIHLPGLIVVLASLISFVVLRPVVLFPADDSRISLGSYNDQVEGGISLSRVERTNDSLVWNYYIRDGIEFPFAGLVLSSNRPEGIEIVPYTRLRLRLRARTNSIVTLQIRCFLPGLTDPAVPLSYRFYVLSIPLTTEMKTLVLPLDDFKTPSWWFRKSGIPDDFGYPDRRARKNFFGLEIVSHDNTIRNVPHQIELESIEFLPPVAPRILALAAACGFSLMVELVLRRKRHSRSGKHMFPEGLKRLDVSNIRDDEEKRLFGYLFSHYNEADLSLEKLLAETALPEKKVSGLIRTRTGLTFKGFLNNLRLDESRRLLRETDRNVTEIAFLVGYNSCSHFNRVFHASEGMTPTGYRLRERV